MLGWILKGGENASDANLGADSTIVDQPDTPAPVFAARAFKSALFGTPAAKKDEAPVKHDENTATSDQGSATPSKPTGILLTPGTGAARRKRVSFGHDVQTKNIGGADGEATTKAVGARKTTRLTEALENARRKRLNSPSKMQPSSENKDNSDDDWEEAEDVDEGQSGNHDITLDLNEPHSQSGRYWKEEFDKYQRDAKVELDKLLHYKKLVKSYAQQKDAEAIQLAEMLKDEQHKVIKMEKKIAENASEIVSQHRHTSDGVPDELISKLAKQTSLAAQYRHRVQTLEEQLEHFIRGKEEDPETKVRRQRQVASPNTRKTLLETQRELRRARSQVKEMDSLREQISSLKTKLKNVESKARNSEGGHVESARASDLRTQLNKAKEESRKKDEEIMQLKKDFEEFREASQLHDTDTKAVLERAHTKISDLKKEIKSLKSGSEELRPKSLHFQPQPEQRTKEHGLGTKVSGQDIPLPGRSRNSGSNILDDNTRELKSQKTKSRAPREMYEEDAEAAPGFLADRPTLEKPKWQPFVPRSPRNRAYLGEDLAKRIQAGAAPSITRKPAEFIVPDLPALSKSIVGRGGFDSDEDEDDKIDLLQDRFAKLGGPHLKGRADTHKQDRGNMKPSSSRGRLPPERRAAAMAKIERRMAEKKRAQRRHVSDKENVRPRAKIMEF